jgi:hypothetical protein
LPVPMMATVRSEIVTVIHLFVTPLILDRSSGTLSKLT